MRQTNNTDKKREKEKKLLRLMIQLYCKGKRHGATGLCKDCGTLLNYSQERINHCPFMDIKTFCSRCIVHCYKPDMKAKIKEVMRYSGPRMIWHHPLSVISHMITVNKKY